MARPHWGATWKLWKRSLSALLLINNFIGALQHNVGPASWAIDSLTEWCGDKKRHIFRQRLGRSDVANFGSPRQRLQGSAVIRVILTALEEQVQLPAPPSPNILSFSPWICRNLITVQWFKILVEYRNLLYDLNRCSLVL